MPHYRIYPLDSANRIVDVVEGEFEDDASAIGRARTLLPACPGVEVWQLERLVSRLSPDSMDREAQTGRNLGLR